MNQIFRLNPSYKICEVLEQNDMPPTLYSLMNSMINYNSENPVKIEELSKYARLEIFDFDYPLNSQFKENFEVTFLDHYMERRIGFETYTSFKIHLKSKLNEIMPKYNKMLEGYLELDFLGTKEVHVRNEKGVTEAISNSNSSTSTTNDNRYSDTPQNELEDVRDGRYVSDYTYTSGTNNSLNEINANNNYNTDENITITKGDSTDEYIKFSKINSIYSLIFDECDILFFGLM